MEPALQGRVFDYGVRRAPFLVDGLPAIMAVDAHGNIRKVRKLRPGDDAEALGERMWNWLLEHYPEAPQLRILKAAPVPAPPAPAPGLVTFRGRQLDPRLLCDPRSPIAKALYRERLARQSVQRSGILRFRPDD